MYAGMFPLRAPVHACACASVRKLVCVSAIWYAHKRMYAGTFSACVRSCVQHHSCFFTRFSVPKCCICRQCCRRRHLGRVRCCASGWTFNGTTWWVLKFDVHCLRTYDSFCSVKQEYKRRRHRSFATSHHPSKTKKKKESCVSINGYSQRQRWFVPTWRTCPRARGGAS